MHDMGSSKTQMGAGEKKDQWDWIHLITENIYTPI